MLPSPLPSDIYLDTSIVIEAMFQGTRRHAEILQFCRELTAQSSHIYFSQILRLELSQTLFRLPKSGILDASVQRQWHLGGFDARASVRRAWMDQGVKQFEAFIAQFVEVVEHPLTLSIWQRSIDVMVSHRLRAHDAIHVATAAEIGLRDFATLDRDHFDRLERDRILTLWPR